MNRMTLALLMIMTLGAIGNSTGNQIQQHFRVFRSSRRQDDIEDVFDTKIKYYGHLYINRCYKSFDLIDDVLNCTNSMGENNALY